LPSFINTYYSYYLSTDVRLFNTLPHVKHYWVFTTDLNINDGCSDSGNLIAGGLTDLGGA